MLGVGIVMENHGNTVLNAQLKEYTKEAAFVPCTFHQGLEIIEEKLLRAFVEFDVFSNKENNEGNEYFSTVIKWLPLLSVLLCFANYSLKVSHPCSSLALKNRVESLGLSLLKAQFSRLGSVG